MSTSSPALETFLNRLREVEVLLELCEVDAPTLKEKSKTRERDEALCRAALVLLCGHMEGFFEDLIVDVLRFHEKNKTEISGLPLRIRVLQIWRPLGLSDNSSDENRLKAIENIRANALSDETQKCDDGMLNPDIHTKGFATPGSKEVEKLLYSIGIDGIWLLVKAKKSGSLILKGSLDAVVSRRHPIAHGDAAATATPNDVRQYINDMLELALTVDEIINEYLSKTHSLVDAWSIF